MEMLFQNFRRRGWLGLVRASIFCLLVSGVVFSQPAQAGESLFGYSYVTDTMPKNKWELEQWYWGKYGKKHGDYANSLYRTEIEYGVTDNYQVSLYTNERHVYSNKTEDDGSTGGEDLPANFSGDKSYNHLSWEGISMENIYRILSPYKHPVGLALYFEPSFGPNEIELEPKIILQKNFLEDRLVTIFNFFWEFEWDREKGGKPITDEETGDVIGFEKSHWAKESAFEADLGASYRFAPNWSAGIEGRIHNEVASFKPKDIEHTAFFFGPNIHYARQRFWVTATVLFQLPFVATYNEEQQQATKGGRVYGEEHESVELRVKTGWLF